MNKIKKVIRKLIDCFNKCFSLIFYVCPVKKNKVTFCNFAGKGYGCNPKYLAEQFRRDKTYELIWFVSDLKDESIPKEIKKIKYGSLKHYYHMITAKLWIDNIRNSINPILKRKNQIFVQTWHGGFGVKGIEKDVEEFLSNEYVKKAKRSGKLENYILSGSVSQSEQIKRAFWTDAEILKLGIPRDDVLFEIDEKELSELRKRLKIENKKVILYAPSFRVDKNFYKNLEFDSELLIKKFNQKFGGEHIVAIRLHPNDATPENLLNFKNVLNFGNISDSHTALHLADYLISDYSTMAFDFARLNKLSMIYAPDYEDYVRTERKLYVDLRCMFFPFAETFNELIYALDKFSQKEYQEKLSQFCENVGFYDNHKSSEKVFKFLKKIIK